MSTSLSADFSSIESIPTPSHCTADFCLIPVRIRIIYGGIAAKLNCPVQIGTGSASVSAQVADVQRLVERSGLKYVMHSAGTTLGVVVMPDRVKIPIIDLKIKIIEGPWDQVHKVIGQAHTILHQQGVVRIQSDIRSGSR
jgi:uncharacterized protein YqgV (UPF0045/DUF77 family)